MPRERCCLRWYKETLETTTANATVVAEFEDGSPAAVMSSFGKGRTLMLGSYVSASAQSTPTPEAERFFRSVLQWAGVQFPVTVGGAPLEVRYTESGNETLVFVFNHGNARARGDVMLTRPPGHHTAVDLVQGSPVRLERDTNAIAFEVDLPARGVQVLRVTSVAQGFSPAR